MRRARETPFQLDRRSLAFGPEAPPLAPEAVRAMQARLSLYVMEATTDANDLRASVIVRSRADFACPAADGGRGSLDQ